MLLPLPHQFAVQTTLLVSLLTLVVLSVLWGKQYFLLADVLPVLRGEANPFKRWLLLDLRLPRALAAAGVGMALGAAGAVFQSLTRNALGSPDIIGINAGAAVGAVAASLIWPGFLTMEQGALFGSLTVLILILVGTKGRLNFGMEIIISGLAVNAAAMALVQFGLISTRQENAQQMTAWLSGSLEARSWIHVATVWTWMPLMLLVLHVLNIRLSLLALGKETASGLGVNIKHSSWALLMAATVLAAAAVTAAGPIAFVAFAAPHIVRRLMKTDRPLLWAAALSGGVLLLTADLTARLLPTSSPLPVGVVTAALGGAYLTFLLSGKNRLGR
ncbi:FecCD family ABC transporter permease [Neisseria iguanae]|nr:iron chelate uptake ABC transporter family permease subunit [Neisseria iguanae]